MAFTEKDGMFPPGSQCRVSTAWNVRA